MSLGSHLQELKKKHATLSARVEAEMASPGSDSLEVAALKKRKLALKQEIARLSEGVSA
ncbi:DUF465 domain-containing protein [Jannaschia sp. Os4]|uniref:YdcH family protein n=1 Tax=Jannaschia sp. Os4 TaxID=2807617 RepID=UPI00193ADA8A|nr:DUF465 domain-containing protein [Jannaschia sp. Os4]MBM2577237.1 DUF465 domain-containing protein [Jannaschia sp. Os4]